MSQQVIDFLNKLPGGSEAVQITTYEVYIGNRSVTVRVRDAGEGADRLRYSVEAEWTDVDDQSPLDTGHALGNPEPGLNEALWNAHWQNFKSHI